MIAKVLTGADSILDHELLEVLLYNVIPRRDTNPLAHKILHTFGSLDLVFKATPAELMSVKGVGEKTAAFISLVGRIYRLTARNVNKTPKNAMFSFANNKNDIIKMFEYMYDEKFVLILLDEHYRRITDISFENNLRNKVEIEVPEIANAFAINKPSYAIMAHNHPSGALTPSLSDDETTAKMHLLCSFHGVTLIDHVIVGGKDAVSYFLDGRLKEIKDACNIESVIHKVKEINYD